MILNLMATDPMGSVVFSNVLSTNTVAQSYTVYGDCNTKESLRPGFNGERVDPLTGMTHLGNGYRDFNPGLQRFNVPDSWSPFGDGGLNAYAYCEGDPVNRSDPSGHAASTQNVMGMLVSIAGLVLGGIAGSAAIGAARGAKAVVKATAVTTVAVLSGAAGVATGVASAAVEDPDTAAALGWASLGLGAVSIIAGGSLMMMARSTAKPGRARSPGHHAPAAGREGRSNAIEMTAQHGGSSAGPTNPSVDQRNRSDLFHRAAPVYQSEHNAIPERRPVPKGYMIEPASRNTPELELIPDPNYKRPLPPLPEDPQRSSQHTSNREVWGQRHPHNRFDY